MSLLSILMSLIFWPSSHESQSCLSHYILGSFFFATLAIPETSVLELSSFHLMFVSFFSPYTLPKVNLISSYALNYYLQINDSIIFSLDLSSESKVIQPLFTEHILFDAYGYCRLVSSERSLRIFSLKHLLFLLSIFCGCCLYPSSFSHQVTVVKSSPSFSHLDSYQI